MKEALDELLSQLKENEQPGYVEKMKHFAIDSSLALGIKTPVLKQIAKPYHKNQPLAEALYLQAWHECKLMCAFTADPKAVSLALADEWVKHFYSWDLVDQFCSCVFGKTDFAWTLPERWAPLQGEYQRRAGIVMVAVLSMQYKKVPDSELLQFLPLLEQYATDERNFVKKAVSWAARTLGKRSFFLNHHLLTFAEELLSVNSKAAQWTARDVIRELQSDAVQKRLQKKEF